MAKSKIETDPMLGAQSNKASCSTRPLKKHPLIPDPSHLRFPKKKLVFWSSTNPAFCMYVLYLVSAHYLWVPTYRSKEAL